VDEGSARRKDFILTTHNTHKRGVNSNPHPPVNKQKMTDALNRAATIIGVDELTIHKLQVSRFMCRYFRWVVLEITWYNTIWYACKLWVIIGRYAPESHSQGRIMCRPIILHYIEIPLNSSVGEAWRKRYSIPVAFLLLSSPQWPMKSNICWSMSPVWWTKWQWDSFISGYFVFSCQLSLHQCPIHPLFRAGQWAL